MWYCHHKSSVHMPQQVNGVPACADAKLLNDTLRQQWGFDGFVVSDCGAVEAAAWGHNYRKCGRNMLQMHFAANLHLMLTCEEGPSLSGTSLQGQRRGSRSNAGCWHGHEL